MSFARNIVAALAPALPVGLSHSLTGSPLILPYYHMVSDEALPHVRPLYRYRTVREFTTDLDFFLKHFKPVGLEEVLAHFQGGAPLAADAFLLTFDDGFREMAETVAPILKARGISAAFFVNSAFVDNRELCFHQKIALLITKLVAKSSGSLENELKTMLCQNGIHADEPVAMLKSMRYADRAILEEIAALLDVQFDAFLQTQKPYLTSAQIRGLLHDGFNLGGHSVDHPFYADLTLGEQLRQTRDSMEFVTREFNLGYRAFAFPHSDTGVTQEFFKRSYGDGTLEISFGTSGLLRDAWPGHFQRFSMEKTGFPPEATVMRQLARRCFRGVFGGDTVLHPN